MGARPDPAQLSKDNMAKPSATFRAGAQWLAPVLDPLCSPLVGAAAILLKGLRRVGIQRFPLCRRVLRGVGVFPIRDHYYEPLFDPRHLTHPLDDDRILPGIDWNTESQLRLLESFDFGGELLQIPEGDRGELTFNLANTTFGPGDAEYWYSLIRSKKPAVIIEIGSGNSTLMAARAIRRNMADDPSYKCRHTCIEPYEMPWLEQSGVEVIRKRVEEVGVQAFSVLGENDILFIDSSHMIRPQGDVLFEYLELLPTLKSGVIVHIHDIFSPKNYPAKWVCDEVRFWNEQYLLEAFLSGNADWRILGAVNHLQHHFHDRLAGKCPHLKPIHEPGSFYIQRR